MLSDEGRFGIGEGSVWALTVEGFEETLTRINIRDGLTEAKISLPSSGSSIAVAYGFVWVTAFPNELYRIDAQTNKMTAIIKLHENPRDLAAGEGSIWVLNQGDSSVQRIDAKSGELLTTIETGLPPGSAEITTGGGYVWVSMPGVPITQIDPKTNTLLHKFVGGHGIGGRIRYGGGSLWIAGGHISRLQPPN
jgi:DNA-binding beta-propeller fold protein YncE